MLEVKNVIKGYDSCQEALSGVSLSVEGKGVYSILGDRGAGKTALARIICGCEDADGGEVQWNGDAMCRKNTGLKKNVRLVPSELLLDNTTTASEYLDFVGDTLEIAPEKRYRQIKEALELVAIDDVQNRPFGSLNYSQRCRLAIAAALLGNPEVLVLDDPFAGIGEAELSELYQLVEMLGKIKTVIFFTHSTDEVRKLSEYIYILHDGKIALGGVLSEILAKLNSTCQIYMSVRGEEQTVCEAIRTVDTVLDVRVTGTEKNGASAVSVEYSHDEMIKEKLFSALARVNAPILSMNTVTLGLDDIFYTFRSSSKRTENSESNSKKKSRRAEGRDEK